MRSLNVIFSQNPRIGPCRAIPLEQLTIGICGRKSSKGKELRLIMTWIISTMMILSGAYQDLDSAERVPGAEDDIHSSNDHNYLVNY